MNIKTLMQKEGAALIDVREPWEFQRAHAEGAILIPLGELMRKLNRFREIEGPILLYCRSGNRSGLAAAMLQAEGFSEAYNIGGLNEVLDTQEAIKHPAV